VSGSVCKKERAGERTPLLRLRDLRRKNIPSPKVQNTNAFIMRFVVYSLEKIDKKL